MRVALVSPTVGQTRRGYERFMTDLHRVLGGDVELTLFKGAGPARPGEKVVPHLRRVGLLSRLARGRLRYLRHHLEFLSFGLGVLPHLVRGDFDLVHFIDPPLARSLSASRRLCHKRFGLLFTDAGPAPYDCSRWADHIHCLTPAARQQTLDGGLPEARLTMLPVGVEPGGFRVRAPRAELRQRCGIPEGSFVILSVASLNRHHKRLDHLIEEVARLSGEPLLWLDGSMHPDGDPTLLELAAERLGNRWRHTHLPSEQVGELYRLADVLVSTALDEPFGMAVVEAMAEGLPVVTHDSAHFRWLVGGAGHHVGMAGPGALAALLGALMRDRSELRRPCNPSDVLARFGWPSLRAGYLRMYETVARPRDERV
jgi:glycosyltransferase involved in cell wall biosynthesis